MIFHTTLTVAQRQIFDQLVAAFRTTYTTNVEVLKVKLKAARQQPNQTIAAFLCDVRTFAGRVYRRQPLIEEKWFSPVSSKDFTMHNSYGQMTTSENYFQPTPVLPRPSQSNCMLSWKVKITENRTTTVDITSIKTIEATIVAISKTTDITTIAMHQTNNKTETTRTNQHLDIVTEQIISPRTVKPVLTAQDWDIRLANVEHHGKIKTIGNKIRMSTKTRIITNKIATQIPLSNKIL